MFGDITERFAIECQNMDYMVVSGDDAYVVMSAVTKMKLFHFVKGCIFRFSYIVICCLESALLAIALKILFGNLQTGN